MNMTFTIHLPIALVLTTAAMLSLWLHTAMRMHEIIGEAGDTWEQRFAATKRREAKRVKAVGKLRTAQAGAAEQARSAAAKRAKANDRITAAQRNLANTPTR